MVYKFIGWGKRTTGNIDINILKIGDEGMGFFYVDKKGYLRLGTEGISWRGVNYKIEKYIYIKLLIIGENNQKATK